MECTIQYPINISIEELTALEMRQLINVSFCSSASISIPLSIFKIVHSMGIEVVFYLSQMFLVAVADQINVPFFD
jgi:hypothetical protein